MYVLKIAAHVLFFYFCSSLAFAEDMSTLTHVPSNIVFSVSYNPVAQANSPHVLAIIYFKNIFEELMEHKVSITISWNDALSPSYPMAIKSLLSGKINFTQIPSGALSAYTSALLPLNNLFLFPYPHTEIAYRAIDGEVGEIIRKRVIEETGMRIVSFWEVGFRHLNSVDKQITKIEDMKNLKWRVQPNSVHEAAFKSIGVVPVPIPWKELYSALQKHAVDGAENPLLNIMDNRLYEVEKYITLSGHAFEFVCFVTSQEFYLSMPPQMREAWDEAARQTTFFYRKKMAESEREITSFLAERMIITPLSEIEKIKFEKATRASWEKSAELSGKEYHDNIVEKIEEITSSYLQSH